MALHLLREGAVMLEGVFEAAVILVMCAAIWVMTWRRGRDGQL